MQRDHLSQDDALARIRSQMPIEQKKSGDHGHRRLGHLGTYPQANTGDVSTPKGTAPPIDSMRRFADGFD
jgi:hypothetical protein